jgi:beta-phosphoglucomutase-like phosphatase (HAD superfamily)
MIKYLFFDCDNTLVLSEDAASEICADLVNEVLQAHNINIKYSQEDLIVNFVGLSLRWVLVALQEEHGFVLEEEELKALLKRQEDLVIANINASLSFVHQYPRTAPEGSRKTTALTFPSAQGATMFRGC